jgi:hypothetical protein
MLEPGGAPVFRAPSLTAQIDEARAQYQHAYARLTEAAAFYKEILKQNERLRRVLPGAHGSRLAEGAIQDCAYWDAEASAAEIRLARLARIAVAFDAIDEPSRE